MKIYSGHSLLNTAINNLPIELHIPGYQYCGPGTKLEKSLAIDDIGINGLDRARKYHDVFYSQGKDITRRHTADKVLMRKALERFRSKGASFGEKLSAFCAAGAMKAKVKLGMGLGDRHMIQKCLKKFVNIKLLLDESRDMLKNTQNWSEISCSKRTVNRRDKKKQKNKLNLIDTAITEDMELKRKNNKTMTNKSDVKQLN